MDTGNILTILATAFYLVGLILVVSNLRLRLSSEQKLTPPPAKNKLFTLVWLIALLLQIASLHFPLFTGQPMGLDIITAASYVMWLLNLILFITSLKRKVQIMAVLVLPVTILVLILHLLFKAHIAPMVDMQSGLGIHILSSLLAYSMLMLASFQALLLAVQNNQLHKHQASPLIRTLPSLEDMEHLLFQFISIGVGLLTIGLLSGFYFLENLFGANIAHKTILSIIAWLVFSILLYGRWKYGWRGRKAVHWTLTGFIILMLAFFGTKLIHEFILPANANTAIINPLQSSGF